MSLYFPKNDNTKPLDGTAFALIIFTLGLLVLGLLLRTWCNSQVLRQQVQSVGQYNGVWFSLPKQFAVVNGDKTQFLDKDSLKLTTKSAVGGLTLVPVPNQPNQFMLWLRMANNEVNFCKIGMSSTLTVIDPCQTLPTTKNQDNYYNLTRLPANQMLLLNNFSSKFQLADAFTGTIKHDIDTYHTPPLPTQAELEKQMQAMPEAQRKIAKEIMAKMGSVDGKLDNKLYRPNQGSVETITNALDNTSQSYYVQTDTGNQRMLAWQIKEDGLPDFSQPAQPWLTNAGQPYFFVHLTNQTTTPNPNAKPLPEQWLVLESGAVLSHAVLRQYYRLPNTPATMPDKSMGTDITLPLDDPTLLTALSNQQALVGDASTGKFMSVDISQSNPQVKEWRVASFQPTLDGIYRAKKYFSWASKLVMLLILAPLFGIFWLYRNGYNLNQKL